MRPKTWADMTDEEKGALLLAHHEGKDIEIYSLRVGRWVTVSCVPSWFEDRAYRVNPKRKAVTMCGGIHNARGFWCFGGDISEAFDTHRITFDVIDGEPDCASIKMERIDD